MTQQLTTTAGSPLRRVAEDYTAEALGRAHRDDPVLTGTGGPAGNARLTAWTGLVLLVLFLAELVTLLDVHNWVSWHVAIGVLLIPPALLKTATTGWRIVRYYTGNAPYRAAGPPPLALRVLGPLVVAATLGVLGSGVALILASPDQARDNLGSGLLAFSLLNIHKLTFLLWAVVTGLHTLGRLIPALRLTVVPALARRVPGRTGRAVALTVTAAMAVAAMGVGLAVATPWRTQGPRDHFRYERQR